MMERKTSVGLLLIFLLSIALSVPTARTAPATLTINTPSLPPGHESHVPLQDTGFWLNTGTLADPVWTFYAWGSTVESTPGTVDQFDIKVPAQIRDFKGHSFRITAWPDVTVVYGPEAEPEHIGPARIRPTYRWRLWSWLGTGTTTPTLGRCGPQIDILRWKIIKSPDAQLIAMQTGQVDAWGSFSSPMDLFWHKLAEADGLLRTGDIEKLEQEGFTITYDAAFHIGHIGYNIRPRPGCWPLADVAFRHALFHCYDQYAIIQYLYGYTVTPIHDLVPPAHGGWMNPNVPTHPYNPGNPFTSPPTEHSSCGILKAAGYTFVDSGTLGAVDPADYWMCPCGEPVPQITLWTPLPGTAWASYEHGAWFVSDLAEIGLASSTANGNSGFVHEPAEFNFYMNSVTQGIFDAYMAFWNLERFPTHLYYMCHSSQDSLLHPGRNNCPGINDPLIDSLLDTLMTSLNHADKLQAAYDVQERLYDPDACNQALAYMALYSKINFNAFNPNLRGIVKSPGYGAHNKWTLLNMRWAVTSPGAINTVNWILPEEPERLNPLSAQTKYSWAVMSPVLDGLLMVNPYSHEDLPWLCSQLPVIVVTATGMEITFYLRRDVFWQDGNPYKAQDAKFNWDFLKNNQIPRFAPVWQHIENVVVIDDYTVKVILNVTGQFLVYGLAATAAMLPPPVWGWLDGQPLTQILAYDPSTNTTKPTDAGPWFCTPPGPCTQLYGTGPFVFDYYDPVGQIIELHQFPGYFRITGDIYAQKVEMFHEVGDVNYDGYIWIEDIAMMAVRYGRFIGDPEYDPACDVNQDGVIDMIDLSLANFHFGEQREYPVP